ncbi:hypothetical protein BBK36DRAFT_1207513 [Trichoderma citrinoviride]|uniref:Uncharacterized protein n=1 Tax=Trichoderma citrinoviride TaxID=58853 RepID=A0A2T4BFC1_9HYPO|nr:hypothetical protein BBK36DRAFT_1207513 [Trichoderma citrinoviride]PTB68005.1 hypothetical protein BBK36DRAFT_1207513 [Trichoderma citrinoviride]
MARAWEAPEASHAARRNRGFGWPPATRTQVAAMSEVGKPQDHLAHWARVDMFDAAGLAVWKSCLELLLPVRKKGKREPRSAVARVRASSCRGCEAAKERLDHPMGQGAAPCRRLVIIRVLKNPTVEDKEEAGTNPMYPYLLVCLAAAGRSGSCTRSHAHTLTIGNLTLPLFLHLDEYLTLYLHQPALFPPRPYPGLPPMAGRPHRFQDFSRSLASRPSKSFPAPDALGPVSVPALTCTCSPSGLLASRPGPNLLRDKAGSSEERDPIEARANASVSASSRP